MTSGEVVGQLKRTAGQLDIEWEVDFLSLSAKVNDFYYSPICFFNDTAWCIKVYPNGETSYSSQGYIGVYVVRKDSGPPVTATYSFFLKTTSGRKDVKSERKHTFKGKDRGFGFDKFLKRSELFKEETELMPSGTLRIICSLKFDLERQVKADEMLREALKDITKSTEEFTQTEANYEFDNEQLAAAVRDTKVLRDFKKLCLSGENCDVTLQVSGQPFEAHRCILAARSPVFASMLSHDMREKNTGRIDIVDCDPETLADFLRFLYCGNVEIITSQNACRLYRAADKYNVEDLRSECLAFIKRHLDVDNFCDVIALAVRHREVDLVKQATDFFVENSLKIVMTAKWQVFATENPVESNELTIKALSANKA